MNKPLAKILLNPIRLTIVSALLSVENCDFNYLKKITGTTQGNLSIQLKKLKEEGYIDVKKTFENNYPKTRCAITPKGKKSFEVFYNNLISYQPDQSKN